MLFFPFESRSLIHKLNQEYLSHQLCSQILLTLINLSSLELLFGSVLCKSYFIVIDFRLFILFQPIFHVHLKLVKYFSIQKYLQYCRNVYCIYSI